MDVRYRPSVAGILRDGNGKILIAERIKHEGAWQFPQGGVDEGEDPLEALHRELKEEIGITCDLYEIIRKRGGYRYEFADGRLKSGVYGGQEQTYFLCDYRGDRNQIRIDTPHAEFRNVLWIQPAQFELGCVPMFKRQVYQQVFRDFFETQLS